MILHCGSYLQWWDRRSAIANFLFVLMQWYQRYLHFKDRFDYWAIIYHYFLAIKQTSREDGHKLNFSMSTFCAWCAIVLVVLALKAMNLSIFTIISTEELLTINITTTLTIAYLCGCLGQNNNYQCQLNHKSHFCYEWIRVKQLLLWSVHTAGSDWTLALAWRVAGGQPALSLTASSRKVILQLYIIPRVN